MSRKRELCVKVIRSHLISCPGGLTIHQLERDYEATENEKLPFRLFGHSDVLSFLKSLPSVVRIDYRGHQMSQIILHGIADASSKHVKDMVDHQKTKRNASRPPRIFQQNQPRRPMTHAAVSRKWNATVVSAFIQENVQRVVRKLKAGMTVNLFCNLYEKEIGFPLDGTRHGFVSTIELLKAIPHICHLEYGRRESTGVHVLYVTPPRQIVKKNSPVIGNTVSKPKQVGSDTTTAIVTKSEDVTNGLNTSVNATAEICPPVRPLDSTSSKSELESEIMQILAEHPKGITASSIPKMYEQKFNKYLDIRKFGYHSIIEFVSKINGEVIMNRPKSTSDWIVSLSSNKSEVSASRVTSYRDEEEMAVVLLEVREILLRTREEILLTDLPSIYERMYHHRITDGDENALLNIILKIEGAVIKVNAGGRVTVRAKLNEGRISNIPPDTIGPNASYRNPTLPTVDDQYIDVYVADVSHPGSFTVQIYGRKTTGALNELMDALERFYCSVSDDRYDLPHDMARPGQICASVFAEDLNWHRAMILSEYNDDYAEVVYVDYGTKATVPKNSLKLLTSCFMTLPVQMIKARLAHIKARDLKDWNLQSRNQMLRLCSNKQLIAQVTAVTDEVLSICLCDTTQPDVDVHINDTLVEMEHAVLFPDNLSKKDSESLTAFYEAQFEANRSNGDAIDINSAVLEFLRNDIKRQPNSNECTPAAANETKAVDDAVSTTVPKQLDIPVPCVKQPPNNNVASAAVCTDTKPDSRPVVRYVQRHHILQGRYTLHVINYNGKPMVSSYEISLWFGQTSDVLRPLICMRDLKIEEKVIGRDEKHEDMFRCVDECQVPRTIEKNVMTDVLCLYQLCDLVAIVSGLGHFEQSWIVEDITKILDSFDASSDYWYVDSPEHETDNLESKRKELQEIRIALLEKLAEKSDPMTVDKITGIERRICSLTLKIRATNPKKVCETDKAAAVNNKGPKLFEPNNPFLKNSVHTVTKIGEMKQYENDDFDECPPLVDTTKQTATRVAEVLPFKTENRLDSNDELSAIPGAQLNTEVLEFIPASIGNSYTGTSGSTMSRQAGDINARQSFMRSTATMPQPFMRNNNVFAAHHQPAMFMRNNPGFQHSNAPRAFEMFPQSVQVELLPMSGNGGGAAGLYRDGQGRVFIPQNVVVSPGMGLTPCRPYYPGMNF